MIPQGAIRAATEAVMAIDGPATLGSAEVVEAALEAAAPFLRAQALEEAALELMNVSEHDSRMPGIRFAVGFLAGQRKSE